jgi:hypothetical protein
LNWASWLTPALILDLEAWQKYHGFDQNSAYAEMSIDIDLDALALTGSFSEVTTQAPQKPTSNGICWARRRERFASQARCCVYPASQPGLPSIREAWCIRNESARVEELTASNKDRWRPGLGSPKSP